METLFSLLKVPIKKKINTINEGCMTILDTIKSREEEFDKEFHGYLVLTDGDKSICKPRKAIKSFHTASIIAVLEAVLKEMPNEEIVPSQIHTYEKMMKEGWNQCRIQSIKVIKNVLKSLKV